MRKAILVVALATGLTLGMGSSPAGSSAQYNYEKQMVSLGSVVATQPAISTATPVPTAAPTATPIVYHKKYTNAVVNLRKKPSVKSKIKYTVPYGKKVCVSETCGKWSKVKVGKRYGYIKTKYLVNKKPKVVTKKDTLLSGYRKRNADKIALTCIKNYKKYGVLPSVAVAQAFVESGIGQAMRGYNYFGINSGRGYNYSSTEEATIAYCKVINNGCYKGAPFAGDYRTQISRIINGGYCEPAGAYIANACDAIQTYHLYDYDKYVK